MYLSIFCCQSFKCEYLQLCIYYFVQFERHSTFYTTEGIFLKFVLTQGNSSTLNCINLYMYNWRYSLLKEQLQKIKKYAQQMLYAHIYLSLSFQNISLQVSCVKGIIPKCIVHAKRNPWFSF